LNDFETNLIKANIPKEVIQVLVKWKDMAVNNEFKNDLKYILNSEYFEDGHILLKFNWGVFKVSERIAKKKLKDMLNDINYEMFSISPNQVIIEPFDEE